MLKFNNKDIRTTPMASIYIDKKSTRLHKSRFPSIYFATLLRGATVRNVSSNNGRNILQEIRVPNFNSIKAVMERIGG